jgi:hypothetical protein
MASTVVAQISVRQHKGHVYAIYLAKKRLGFVGLAKPGQKNPINWLPKAAGGLDMEVSERIVVVEKIRELMAAEWAKHEADLQKLRDLENGLVTAEEGETTEQEPNDGSAATE